MFFFFKQKTAYEMRISDWSSDVCSSDLHLLVHPALDPVGVADLAPGVELRDHFDRQVLALVHPLDRVAHAGAGADVDLAGTQRDIAGDRPPGLVSARTAPWRRSPHPPPDGRRRPPNHTRSRPEDEECGKRGAAPRPADLP